MANSDPPSPDFLVLKEVERLNRLYSALSHVNQAIVRIPTGQELFRAVCEILVDHGQFRMAWIGWNDPSTHRLVPVAHAGFDDGYLQNIKVYTDDRPEGNGPAGTAFREGVPLISNNMLDDAATKPWHEEAAKRGYKACAAFPIRKGDQVCGLLGVYSEQVGFFQDKEVGLLIEAAGDISTALDIQQKEEKRKLAEQEVKRERRFADCLIEMLPGIFYLYNEKRQFLRWNRNFEIISGYGADEIARMDPTEFFNPEDKKQMLNAISEVFENGESSIESSFLSKSGTATPYFFNGKRITFEGMTCLVGMGIDISERFLAEVELRKSEERYRTTLECILEGCQLVDYDWRLVYINDAAAVQNRRPKETMLGMKMTEAWPNFETTPVYKLLEICMTKRIPVHEEVEFVFPDGDKGWFDVRAQPVPEGVFVLSIEVTKRKRVEIALRELNENLEVKINERTEELKAARERAESADRLKSSFLATMSHELRTPLNSIIGFTGIMLKGMTGSINDEQSRQLGMVKSSALHLLDLINDVLDLSKIEAGQLETRIAPFDLRDSISNVVGIVRPLVEKKSLTLEMYGSIPTEPFNSDRRRFEQILLNLLNNAIKFTDRGGVTLTTKVNLEDGTLVIEVEDTGIGIAKEDLNLLFQPFRQIDSGLERHHEGTGLGLVICQRLAKLLGGTIEVRSTPNLGSVFTVTLARKP